MPYLGKYSTHQLGYIYVRVRKRTLERDYNFNCYDETGGLLNVTGSHLRRKSGNISETVQDRDVVIRNTNKCRFFFVTLESVVTR